MAPWYTQPILRRAPAGGLVDPLNGRDYKGGELLPFYVPRPIMPQVDEKDYPTLVSWLLHDKGVDVTVNEACDPAALRAHQRVDRFHAERLPPGVLDKPILVSGDSYVLDGNHRWWAHVHFGINPIPAIRILRPFEEAIGLLFEFPGTYALADHEETN